MRETPTRCCGLLFKYVVVLPLLKATKGVVAVQSPLSRLLEAGIDNLIAMYIKIERNSSLVCSLWARTSDLEQSIPSVRLFAKLQKHSKYLTSLTSSIPVCALSGSSLS